MKKTHFILSIIIALLVGISCNNEENVYKIGLMFPLTGNAAETCINGQKAIQLCVDEWNAKGGIGGMPIEIIAHDTKNETKEGITVANRFIQIDKPNIILSTISAISLNTQPILEKNKIIHMCFVGTDLLFESSPQYTIRNYLTSDQTSKVVVDAVKTKFNKNEFKLFYPHTDMGLSVERDITRMAENAEVKITNKISYNETEQTYRNIILRADLQDTDILYVMGNSAALGRIIKQIRDNGFKGIIIGSEDVVSTSALNAIQNRTDNLYYISLDFSENIDVLKDRFKEIYNEPMSDLAILSYNGIDLLLDYINKSETIDNEILMSNINGFQYKKYMEQNYVNNFEIVYQFNVKKFE